MIDAGASVEIVRVEPAGLVGPNPARNRGLMAARTEWVLLIDDDVALADGCLDALLDEGRRFPEAGAIAPRVVRFENPDVVQHDGASVHFFGEMCFENWWAVSSGLRAPSREIGAASSAAMLVRRRAAVEAGLFDERFVIFREDLDFSLRLRRAGWRLRFRPDARVIHGGAARGPLQRERVRLQSRNRWLVLLKTMSFRCLILTLPLQAAYEFLGLGGGLASGLLFQRVRGLAEAAALAPRVLAARRHGAESRVGDAVLFGAPVLTWTPSTLTVPGAAAAGRLISAAAGAWWRLIAPWLG